MAVLRVLTQALLAADVWEPVALRAVRCCDRIAGRQAALWRWLVPDARSESRFMNSQTRAGGRLRQAVPTCFALIPRPFRIVRDTGQVGP